MFDPFNLYLPSDVTCIRWRAWSGLFELTAIVFRWRCGSTMKAQNLCVIVLHIHFETVLLHWSWEINSGLFVVLSEFLKSSDRTRVPSHPQWQNNRPALESTGERILEELKKGTAVAAKPGESPPPAPEVTNRCFQQLAHSYEEEYGGFRDAPKFPTPGSPRRSPAGNTCQASAAAEYSSCDLCFSESDVPHVLLVCESLHLRRGGGPPDGFAHAPHDGAGRHPRPRGSGPCTLGLDVFFLKEPIRGSFLAFGNHNRPSSLL